MFNFAAVAFPGFHRAGAKLTRNRREFEHLDQVWMGQEIAYAKLGLMEEMTRKYVPAAVNRNQMGARATADACVDVKVVRARDIGIAIDCRSLVEEELDEITIERHEIVVFASTSHFREDVVAQLHTQLVAQPSHFMYALDVHSVEIRDQPDLPDPGRLQHPHTGNRVIEVAFAADDCVHLFVRPIKRYMNDFHAFRDHRRLLGSQGRGIGEQGDLAKLPSVDMLEQLLNARPGHRFAASNHEILDSSRTQPVNDSE